MSLKVQLQTYLLRTSIIESAPIKTYLDVHSVVDLVKEKLQKYWTYVDGYISS